MCTGAYKSLIMLGKNDPSQVFSILDLGVMHPWHLRKMKGVNILQGSLYCPARPDDCGIAESRFRCKAAILIACNHCSSTICKVFYMHFF